MATHVKVLGILNIACGMLGVIGAGLLFLIFAAGAVGVSSSDPDAAVALPLIGITGMALVGFALIVSLPAVIIGWGLYQLRAWARVWGIVISILSLLAIPFGTILGVYGLWVLFSKETEQLFALPEPGRV